MGIRHNYHPHCGCAACSRQELADERADELALALQKSGDVLSETLGEYRIARRVRSGSHAINGMWVDISMPFGGFKHSGIGREGGIEGLHAFLETRTLYLS